MSWNVFSGIRAVAVCALAVGLAGTAGAQRPEPPPLPQLPPTPVMASDPYPACREDYRSRGNNNQQAAATNQCIARLDAYHARVLVPYHRAMIAHQEEIGRIYEDRVRLDFDYTQDQADGFFARVTQEHEDSSIDGAHMADYRRLMARYQNDRQYLQGAFCSLVGC